MYPETAFNEIKTTEFIKNYLEKTGYSVENVKPTGCMALLLKNEKLPTVILRAEMDAVPVTEDTGLEFSSKNKGAMHACGHDGHAAMLLGTAMCSVRSGISSAALSTSASRWPRRPVSATRSWPTCRKRRGRPGDRHPHRRGGPGGDHLDPRRADVTPANMGV